MNLRKFLSASRLWPANAWLYHARFRAYVRISARYIGDKQCTTFEIASIEIPEQRRGKGLFTQFLKDVFALTDCEYVFIENVLNARLAEHLERDGWVRDSMYESLCYYKKVR